jgi:hypothetical protein
VKSTEFVKLSSRFFELNPSLRQAVKKVTTCNNQPFDEKYRVVFPNKMMTFQFQMMLSQLMGLM